MLIVRSGVWLYDGSVKSPVDIVAFDFDWWHQLAVHDGTDEPDEPQPVGPDGLLYCVRFKHAGDATTPTWVDAGGHTTVARAMRTAEANAPSSIEWSA